MNRRHLLTGAVFLAALSIPTTVLPGPQPVEFQVNTYTTGRQYGAFAAMDPMGNFLVTWTADAQDGSGDGIFGRRYDRAGVPLGGEFQVNTFTTGAQYYSTAAFDGSGNFVVAWTSGNQSSTSYDVLARRFSRSGAPLGSDFRVNTTTLDAQWGPSIAVSPSGEFVVAWTSDNSDGSLRGIFARRYDSAGKPRGGEFQVNTYTLGGQQLPAVVVGGSGDFVVVWTSYASGGGFDGIFARRFDSAGVPVDATEFQVNTYTAAMLSRPALGVDGAGDFVVAWSGPDGPVSAAGYEIRAQRFDSAGAPVGSEITVNEFTTSEQNHPSLAIDGSGNFVIAWSGYNQDGSGEGVFSRRFDSTGVALEVEEFQVNTFTTGRQFRPAIAGGASGDFVVAWSSRDQDGSYYGVIGRRYCFAGDADGDGICDTRDVVVTAPGAGDTVDCSAPTSVQPAITWNPGDYDRFRVTISTDPGFVAGSTVTSGSKLLAGTTYSPPSKKWASACRKALAANPLAPVLHIKVSGVDMNAPKSDKNKRTDSQIVQVTVQP